jgi:hypothetical protein
MKWFFLFSVFFILLPSMAKPCSMYKVTVAGKTMVGNNEDSWRRDARIWFEVGGPGEYGMACVGYASKQPNPDGALNEAGLAFDAFTMPYQPNMPARDARKKDFNYTDIKTIMRQCKSVEEVHAYLSALNLHVLNGSPLFNGGMLLFVDRWGKYLVVEPRRMTLGQNDRFALANFSLANTPDLRTIKTERYCKGVAFLNNKPLQTNIEYCRNLSDTMSVHRPRIGDGTLYTTIYDLEQGFVHVYFFHNYQEKHSFNVKEELAKGPHAYNFVELFPMNKGYRKFLHYQTPQNNRGISLFLLASSCLFLFSFVYYLLRYSKAKQWPYRRFLIALCLMSFSSMLFAIVLYRTEAFFYFPAPYHHASSFFLSTMAYWPFVVLLFVVPSIYCMVNVFQQKAWNRLARYLFALNNLVYLFSLVFFFYWGLICIP